MSREYYAQLLADCGTVLGESFQGGRDVRIAAAHSFITDLNLWHECLTGRLECTAMIVAAREYQYALLAVTMGQYRQSFGSLRTFLELTLAALHFSSLELDMRLWLRGERDVSWSKLSDDQNGVLSHEFARAFFPELVGEVAPYRSLAIKLYRECSEFVHANPHTHEVVPGQVRFDEALLDDWISKAATAKLVVTFALVLRYLATFDPESRRRIEAPVLDQLSHITAIRNLY